MRKTMLIAVALFSMTVSMAACGVEDPESVERPQDVPVEAIADDLDIAPGDADTPAWRGLKALDFDLPLELSRAPGGDAEDSRSNFVRCYDNADCDTNACDLVQRTCLDETELTVQDRGEEVPY